MKIAQQVKRTAQIIAKNEKRDRFDPRLALDYFNKESLIFQGFLISLLHKIA